jgi:glycosyltransferase involved in cell wall biosynthesis
MGKRAPYISVIIPTLNEQENIGRVIRGIKSALGRYSYEIIVVDKHSQDRTAGIARELGALVINDSGGKGSALIRGFSEASGKILISMDADLSHRPDELRLLVAGIESGYDMCAGSRFMARGGTEDMPLLRRAGNRFFVWLVNFVYGSSFTDLCYGYRAFKKDAVKKLHLQERGFGIETEMSIKATKAALKIIEVPSYEKKRASGAGKLRTVSDGYAILKTIFSNL